MSQTGISEGDPTLRSDRGEDTLVMQIKVLMAVRMVTVWVLLGVTIYLQWLEKSVLIDRSLVFLYGLCISSFLLTIIYILILQTRFNRAVFAFVQLQIDVLFTGAIIYVTNGFDIFSFLFILTIISSSMILSRRGAIFTAVFSGLVYAVILDLFYYNLIPKISTRYLPLEFEEMVASIFYNCVAFFFVALLSGSLSEQLKRTGRRLEEKQTDLKDLENLNWHIVESLASGLITVNTDGLVISFNRAAEEMTGLTFAEIFHTPIERIFSPIQPYLQGERHRWEEKYFRERDGKTLVLGFSSSPLKHPDGRAIGRIINFQDVSLLKQMQDRVHESNKWAAIGRMAAGIAHEIRNPLASMSGCVQTLRQDLKPMAEEKVLMDIVVRETDRLNLLIQEFLDFAKPKETRLQAVRLDQAVQEILAVSQQHFLGKKEEKNTPKVTVEGTDQQIRILADSGQIKQVLWNLLLNALQAFEGPRGGREERVFVRLYVSPHHEHHVILEIEDTGCGISQQNLTYIFEPFFTTKRKGTGLGLAAVRRIVEENGWDIEIQSTVDKGTTVKVSFSTLEDTETGVEDPAQGILSKHG